MWYIELCKSTQKHFKVRAVEAPEELMPSSAGMMVRKTTVQSSREVTAAEKRLQKLEKQYADKHFNLQEVRILHEEKVRSE